MSGFLDMLKSERGIGFIALAICSTVLAALGHMSIEQWKDFNMVTFSAYVIGKSVTGVAALNAAGKTAVADRTQHSTGGSVEADVKIRSPQSGRARLSVLLGLVATATVALGVLGSTGCFNKDGSRTTFGKLVAGVVDCTTPNAKTVIGEFGPVVEALIEKSTAGTGQVDWSPVTAATKQFTLELGGCVLAAAVQAVLDRATVTVGRTGPAVDEQAARAGFEHVRRTQLNGHRFKTEAGTL